MIKAEIIKKDFPLLISNPDLVYLDSASSSQTPECVLDKVENYYREYRANIHRGLYGISEKASREYESARGEVAKFINADTEEIVFTSGSTLSMNMLVYSLEQTLNFKNGDEILVTVALHHSTLVPLQELAKRAGLTLKFIPLKKDSEGIDIDYDEMENMISEKTILLALPHSDNVLGTVYDVSRAARAAHKYEAIFIVDAAKTAGHMPIDVKSMDCDYLFFSGHKMCAPTGIGILFGKKELLHNLKPSIFGGGMVSEVSKDEASYLTSPDKFEPGTQNIAGAIGLGQAIKYLDKIGVENIHSYEKELTKYATEELRKINGVVLYGVGGQNDNTGVISFNIDGTHPHDVAEIFASKNVAVRAGHHCAEPFMGELGITASVRVSFYLYNTMEDVDKLIEAVEEVKNVFEL